MTVSAVCVLTQGSTALIIAEMPLYLSDKAVSGNLEACKRNNRSYPVPWDPNSVSPPTAAGTARRKSSPGRAGLLSPGEQAPAPSQGSLS